MPTRSSPAPAGLGVYTGILTGSRLNILLLMLPLAVVLELTHAPAGWIFGAAALAVVPLAGLIGRATEELAHRTGPGIGGFLNATFGNGAELLIAGFAVNAGLFDVVKASLSGSIIGNILLVLGLAILVGGWGRERQRFSRVGAGAQTSMLFLAVVAMVMPAIFDLVVFGNLHETSRDLQILSLLSAIVLLFTYGLGLFFSLRTHRDVFSGDSHHGEESAAEGLGGHLRPLLSAREATVLLVLATVMTAIAAEILVGSVEEAAHALGLTDLFIGMIVVAIVGNAAEHFSAVLVARKGDMQLAMNIAKESSVQIALLAAPAMVILSWILGNPMTLVFHPFELFGVALAVGAVALVSLDGESHWYEGVLLLAVYALVAIAVFFLPQASAHV